MKIEFNFLFSHFYFSIDLKGFYFEISYFEKWLEKRNNDNRYYFVIAMHNIKGGDYA